jgi:hypothetical protein
MKRIPISAMIRQHRNTHSVADHNGCETISQETAIRLLDLYVSNGGNLLYTAMV